MRPLRHSTLAAGLLAVTLLACGPGEAPRPTAETAPPAPTAKGTEPRRAASPCADPGRGPEPDAGGLRAFVRKRRGQVRDCYQSELKRNPDLAGKATIEFTIGTCGEVSRAAVVARSGNVDAATACVVRAMRSWRTPFRPAEPVAVEYPFSFSASM
jgi:outer membrane biosynthesis protein TonB